MPLMTGIGLLVTCRDTGRPGELETIPAAALAWEEGRVTWLGPEAFLPESLAAAESRLDARGAMVIPGLVDCHTHLAFAGWRADEFAARLSGRSYLEIARAGGGIRGTVADTRRASREELKDRCRRFLAEMARLGVTTVECKSGYGLDVANEVKLLEVYRDLNDEGPVRLVPTLLAAHVLPREYDDDREGYVRLVCEEIIPRTGEDGLAVFCDVFVEEGAFALDEARRILERGLEFGLRPKLHIDQFNDLGGARLAAELGAASADHLDVTSDRGLEALAAAGVVGVILPLASLYAGESEPRARRLLKAGVATAVSTDFNPGSAPSFHLPLALLLACLRGGTTPAEALLGATRIAARAVGLEAEAGSLEVGKRADFALIDSPDPVHWLYHFRGNACREVYVGGKSV
jgi:imidazolonepropionase